MSLFLGTNFLGSGRAKNKTTVAALFCPLSAPRGFGGSVGGTDGQNGRKGGSKWTGNGQRHLINQVKKCFGYSRTPYC